MASATVNYDCPACHASSVASVSGLSEPSELVSERTRKLNRDLHLYRNIDPENPLDEAKIKMIAADAVLKEMALDREVLETAARVALHYATCPRCGTKNPEGLAEQAKMRRIGWWSLAVLVGATSLGAWFVPKVVAAFAALNVGLSIPGLVARRQHGLPASGLDVAALLLANGLLAALPFVAPRAAFAGPWALVALGALKRRDNDGGEERWRQAAETIRFEA